MCNKTETVVKVIIQKIGIGLIPILLSPFNGKKMARKFVYIKRMFALVYEVVLRAIKFCSNLGLKTSKALHMV